MTRIPIVLLTLGLALCLNSDAVAEEPEEVRDPNGRLVESVDEDDTRAHYFYNDQGVLVEIRYSDGRVVRYDPEPEN